MSTIKILLIIITLILSFKNFIDCKLQEESLLLFSPRPYGKI